MSFEGTGKYFLILFVIYFIVYLTVKICLSKLFKGARISGWKAFIPFYNKLVLVNMLDLKKSVFFKTFIPIGNLYYYYVIISRLLEAYNLDSKEAIWFLVVPMYKFPELVFKRPKFMLHMYDETEKFIHIEKSLFEKEQQKPVAEVETQMQNGTVISPSMYNQMPQNQNPYAESVFSNSSLEPDKRQETTYEAKKEEVKEETNPILADAGKPRVCPKCGTKLPAISKVCFFCGTELP